MAHIYIGQSAITITNQVNMRAKIVILLLSVCLLANAQPPIQKFWALNKCPLLLGTVANVTAAYSLRKLSCTYTGPAIRVRRESTGTNAEGDVYFDASGQVSGSSTVNITKTGTDYAAGAKTTFSAFFLGKNIYVTTWYDQSGNGRNVTQTTSSQQPRIVNAGGIEMSNSKPSIRFINADKTFLYVNVPVGNIFSNGIYGTASLVLEATPSSTSPSSKNHNSAFGFSDGSSDRWQAHMDEDGFLKFDASGSSSMATRLSYANTANENVLRTYALVVGYPTQSMQIYVNGTNVANSNPSSTDLTSCKTNILYIGGMPPFDYGTHIYYHDGHISEIVLISQALNSYKIADINYNQKNYYSITP
jgi:hypothetical protein